MPAPNELTGFPSHFVWGAATSAYQIEGAWNEDGRGPTIWDRFSHQPGRVRHGHHGDIAADHYHRWREDVDWMVTLGLQAYRFSISWSRVLPEGKGQVNQRGLDFYSRLVDALLEKGIRPYPTLFHYDLPLSFQALGGWTHRSTARYFADYAYLIAQHLSDRVDTFITHNEPWITAVLGHLSGEHAPGRRNPVAAFSALHHLLLSHGLAAQAMRSAAMRPLLLGIALNLTPVYPASESARDHRAQVTANVLLNRIVLDPLLLGHYPADLERLFWWPWLQKSAAAQSLEFPGGDLALISTPLEFIGVNYYTRGVVRWAPLIQLLPVKPKNSAYSQMWEIYPSGLYDLLGWLDRTYHHPNLLVTENGMPAPDEISADGLVHDPQRIAYLHNHLLQVRRAIAAGIPVSGYFVWSLLDNFEWALGYARRFGLIYVDFATGKRTLKDSGLWYAETIRQNAEKGEG